MLHDSVLHDDLSSGSIFEGYEIIAPLGEGTFARVYKGRQRSTGQAVAIKMLRLWHGQAAEAVENQIGRFRREMRLCAELSHPNIVRLIDSGTSEDGRLYAVFEYVPGSTLRAILAAEGRLEWAVARHLMTQVLDALACAHARGVVHRDLKPENIMVTRTGAQRNALVLDFGLGGLAPEVQGWSLPRLTGTRELLGTPAYAAPEQLWGEPPSTRADLYSWGLILLECLTGESPISGQSVHEVIVKQLGPEPVPIPPSIRNGRLRRLLQRATAKQPQKRDVSIESILQTLSMIDAEEAYGPRDGAGAEAIVTATPRAAEGERRHLTLLFCDLVGSTELSARLDPEEFREVLGACQQSTAEVVARFGGYVVKYLGDGLLVSFGWPKAREDDAERAVRAGLGLLDALTALNARLPPDVRLAVRVGMHTGPVVVDEGGDVFGETPNVAARLQQLAAPDTLLISAETHRLVAGLFVVEDRGTHTLRGVPEAMALYRVVQSSGVRSRFHARAARGVTPFVGREHERRLLSDRWQRAREGEGQVLLVVGEPGIGKSRLVQTLWDELAAEPHTRIECTGARFFQNTAFHPVIDMLQQALAWRGDEAPEERVGGLERALELAGVKLAEGVPLVAPLLGLAVPERYPPLGLSAEQQRRRLLGTFTAWVCGAARVQPMVIVVEDLHWVDASTLELLGILVEQGATDPLLLLFTARPEFAAPWPSRAHHAHIMLNRLSRREARDMVTRVAAESTLPAETVETLVRRTDGVPLFIEELTRLVLQRGPAAGGCDGHMGGEIPATLEDSLMARLDHLGPAKEVAQVAAVIGREFSYALLRAVLPLRERELEAALDALAEAELIYTRGLPPDATYLFKHALVQDAAYAALLRGRRRELHRLIAGVLRDQFPERAAAQPELLAHHLTEAGEADPAVAAWQEAAQLALSRSAYPEAIGHIERGLAVLSTLPHSVQRIEREIALRSILGVGLVTTKGYGARDVEQNYSRAQELCEELGSVPQLIPTLYGLWTYHLFRDHREATFTLAEQLHQLARSPEHALVATATRGITAFWDGNLHAAKDLLMRAVELYDPRYQEYFARDFSEDAPLLPHRYLIWCLLYLGYHNQARAHCELVKALSTQFSSPYVVAASLVFESSLYISLREPEVVDELAAKIMTLSVDRQFSAFSAVALCARGWVAIQRGDCDQGIAEMRRGVSVLEAAGAMIGLSRWRRALLDGFLQPAKAAEGLGIVDQALASSRDGLTRYYDSELYRLKGELLLLGDPSNQHAAEDCMRRALEVAGHQGAKTFELRAAMSLGRLLRQQGRRSEAHSLLSPIYGWFSEGFDTKELRAAGALLAELR